MRHGMLRGGRKSRVRGLSLERLELRLVLSAMTDTWTGMGSGLWSDANDWNAGTGNAPPQAGDSIVFPSSVTGTQTSTYDQSLTTGGTFTSLTIDGSGYTIGPDSSTPPVAIPLSGAIAADQASGSSTISAPIAFGTTAGSISVENAGATLVISGAISGSDGLSTNGAGTINLTGTNTYTGTTTVGGTSILQVDGTVPAVSVTTGATLSGIGTVASLATTGATVSAGDAGVGTLTDSGGLTLDSASTLHVTLNGTTAGTDYGQLSVGGSINLASATLNLSLATGYTPTVGSQYIIINNTSGTAISTTFSQGSTITVGSQPFSISYAGGSNGKDVVLTALATTTTSVAASTTTPVYGQGVTLTATVTSGSGTPTGTVEFLNGSSELGTATLNNGVATYATSSLPIGTNNISATYEQSSTYASSTSAVEGVTVSEASTTTTLTTSPNPSAIGSSVTLTATVAAVSPGAGTPTGTVEFLNGATDLGTGTLSSGTGSIAVSSLPLGPNSITAVYQSDGNFATSTSTAVTQNVLLASTTSLSSSLSTAVFGQVVTLTATVAPSSTSSGTPTGTVSFTSGTTALGSAALNSSGVATLSTNILPTAANSITATYSGDTTYATSTSSATTVTVSQGSTTTAVTTSPNPSVASQQVALTATITPVSPSTGDPTGSVTFSSGSTTLGTATVSNGVATLDVTTLPVGSSSIVGVYSGDTNYLTSTASAVTQVVTEALSTTTVSVSTTNPYAYQSVTLSVTVAATGAETGTPTGTVTFYGAGGLSLGSLTLTSGTGTLTLTTLPVGAGTITAVYGGDANFGSSQSPTISVVVGSPSELYINQVFEQVTGQVADGGLVYWTDVLDAGYSRKFVINNILKSAQANAYQVTAAYQRFLGRAPSSAEISAALAVPNASINNTSATVLALDEFYTNVGGGTTSGYLDAIAEAWLGRPFAASTKAHYTEQLKHGATRYHIAMEMINSSSGRTAEVNYYYKQIFGTPADKVGLATYTTLLAEGGNISQVIVALLSSNAFYEKNS